MHFFDSDANPPADLRPNQAAQPATDLTTSGNLFLEQVADRYREKLQVSPDPMTTLRAGLRAGISVQQNFGGPILIKTPEGCGKTTGHFRFIAEDIIDQTLEGGGMNVIACRSLAQAAAKLGEFQNSHGHDLSSFRLMSPVTAYRRIASVHGEDPIEKPWKSPLQLLAEDVRRSQPDIFKEVEDYRRSFPHDDMSIVGTSHAMVKAWHNPEAISKGWLHPNFEWADARSPDALENLAGSLRPLKVLHDEIEMDTFLRVMKASDLRTLERLQSEIQWDGEDRWTRYRFYGRNRHLLPKADFDQFDSYMRIDVSAVPRFRVDFDFAPFGRSEEGNIYRERHGDEYGLILDNWIVHAPEISFLTTETLVSHVARAAYRYFGHRLPTFVLPEGFSYEIPMVINAGANKRGRANLAQRLRRENENLVIVADGTGFQDERQFNFQTMKGQNGLKDRDLAIILSHLHPDRYSELNIIGQFIGRSDVIQLSYMDQIDQAAGRNMGFRKSQERQTKTALYCTSGLRPFLQSLNDQPYGRSVLLPPSWG